jgi:tRNA(fMet)-specific endonuclease VapC
MSGRVLLDTNIVIAIFAEELPVLERMAAAEGVFVPAVALGELYYGACKSERAETNIARIGEFAAAAAILVCDALAAQQYGQIKNELRAKGRPIPENDIWIVAVAMQDGLTVATRDDDHFSQIAGLGVEVW